MKGRERLRSLYGDAGASAFAAALSNGAMPDGRRLWMAGPFSASMGAGFRALTSACDAKPAFTLELDNGIPWGL